MKHKDTHDFFLPGERGERRSGLDRRQFWYDVYIPERRLGCDRRRFRTASREEEPVAPEAAASDADELTADEAFEEKIRI